MKAYLSLFVLALGLLFGLNTVEAALNCPKCKAAIPATTKPVVEMAKADIKCSVCGMAMKANTPVTKITCPACKAELSLCAMDAKSQGQAMATDAMGKAQKTAGQY